MGLDGEKVFSPAKMIRRRSSFSKEKDISTATNGTTLQFKTCSMSWKHQSRAVCVLGACCKDSAWFSRRWEALRFLRLLRRHSMQREKRWNTL